MEGESCLKLWLKRNSEGRNFELTCLEIFLCCVMLYMLFNDRSTCISMDLVVGNKICGCLIISLELKLGFELGFGCLAKD